MQTNYYGNKQKKNSGYVIMKKKDMYIAYNHSYKKRRREGGNKTVLFLICILVGLGLVTFYLLNIYRNKGDNLSEQQENSNDDVENSYNNENQQVPQDGILETDATKETESVRMATQVKGIYVTAKTASSMKLNELIELTETTEVNAMVIDVKDDNGRITFSMDSLMVQEIGADTNGIKDIKNLLKSLKEKNIYAIARIVAFKDPYLAEQRQDLAIRNEDGSLYRDNKGECWVNPYLHEVWDYLIEVSTRTAELGFDEIQFDYIRFSTGGGMEKIDFGEAAIDNTKENIIVEFTKYAYEKLKPLGVFVSADVYGTIISSEIDAGLVGQNYVEMAKYLDYICPMIYPSHFGEGNYGLDYPDMEPYKMIRKVLTASNTKLDQIPEGEHCAIVRPWLQDFTASWLKNYIVYGGTELREQIKGVYSVGYDEWLLWNASSNYSTDGLLE